MFGQDRLQWEKIAFAALIILTAIILFTRLGSFPLQMQWEPNYGQVIREMVWGEGDILTPTCKVGSDEGAAPGTFWSKPIMIFWLSYPFYTLLGDSEWSARLPIALLGFLGIIAVIWQMSRLYSRRVGLLSGLLLITSPTYFLISRAFMVDLPFVMFMFVGVLFLMMGEKENRSIWYHLFYVFMGLSSLAKGLTPVILVGMIVFAYCLISMDWGFLRRMKLHTGALIYLAVASPWYIYMSTKYGMPYVKKFFWDHHVERSLGKLDKPNATFEMWVLYFSIGILPWITFLPQAVVSILPWKERKADKMHMDLFWVVGFMVIFSFFSVISTKFPHYIFPAVPFVAIIIAIYLDRLFTDDSLREINRVSFFAALLVLAIVAPDLLDMKNYRTLFYFITTERLQDWHPNVADPTRFFTIVFILWGAVLAVAFLWRRFNAYILSALVVLSLTYSFYITMHMIPQLTEMFAARSMMDTYLSLRTSPDEPIAEFTQTWKSRSIKYYIPFNELADKYRYRDYRINNSLESVRQFYNRYKDKRVFIIVEEKQKHYSRLNALWQEASGGETLVKIADDTVPGEPYRPEFWLISNRDNSGRSQRVSKEEMEDQLKNYVRTEAYEPKLKMLADFEGEIQFIGMDPLPESFKPGAELEITMYFKCLKKPSRDMQIFLHAERDQLFRLRGDHVPVDGRYPTNRWQEGEYIKDVYKLDIPDGTTEGELDIFFGFYKGDYRVKVSDGPMRDAEGRLKIGTLKITN